REWSQANYDNFVKEVGRVIRAGILDHPYVVEWINGQRSVGNYRELRKLKRGIERDMAKPLDRADLWINFMAVYLIEDGCSFDELFPKLRRFMKAKDFPGPLFVFCDRCWLVEGENDRKTLIRTVASRLTSRSNLHKRLLIRKSDRDVAV